MVWGGGGCIARWSDGNVGRRMSRVREGRRKVDGG